MCGAVQESRAEVLLCYHHLFEILEQILKSTPDFGRKSITGTQGSRLCKHNSAYGTRTQNSTGYGKVQLHRGSQEAGGNCCPISQLLRQKPWKGTGFGLICGEHVGKEGCCQLQPSCFPIGQWKMRCDGWTDAVGRGMLGNSLMGQKMKGNTIGHKWVVLSLCVPQLSHPGARRLKGCSRGHWVMGEDTRHRGAAGVS